MKELDIKIVTTEKCIEYKNFCFASVSKIYCNGKLCGYKYTPDGNDKNEWYQIFVETKAENEIFLSKDCTWGENCIYTHSAESTKFILSNAKVSVITDL